MSSKIAQIVLALGSLPGTIRPLLLEILDHSILRASLYLEESFCSIYHATLFLPVYGHESTNESNLIYVYMYNTEHRSRHTKEVQWKEVFWVVIKLESLSNTSKKAVTEVE